MTPHDFELLGDIHKGYESFHQPKLLPLLPFIVRLDGRSFHTYTKGFVRPYDAGMAECMKATLKALIEEFHPIVGYTQSDEISLLFYQKDPKQQMVFGGKVSKILSTMAAFASVQFFKSSLIHLPLKTSSAPTFDARVIQYPTLSLATENLLWRETDATRNSVTMLAHSLYPHKELHGKNHNEKLDMIIAAGSNWNHFPTHFKRGVYMRRDVVTRYLTHEELEKIPEQHRPTGMVERSSIEEIVANPIESYTPEERNIILTSL
jgi:tRNA(His) 5'-end guanylyltransferase